MKQKKFQTMQKKIFLILLVGLLTLSLTSAYVRTNYGQTGLSPSFANQPGAGFNTNFCQNRQDFILQVAPFGCTPAVVRSDLLEEQNVPVFCQVAATKLNPLIDVNAIDSLTFQGQYPEGVSGVGFHPAKAALGRINAQVNSPILENIGYAVIVLNQQQNASAMPDFVRGNLTAQIRYDVKNAFGIGRSSFYLPVMTDVEWNEKFKSYGFWRGRGYLRAEDIDSDGNRATISVYSGGGNLNSGFGTVGVPNSDRKIASVNVEKGKSSEQLFLPGFYCMGGMKVQLNSLESPDTRARLEINGEIVELIDGEMFLENKCRIRDIEKQGLVQRVNIKCSEDDAKGFLSSRTFELKISPRVRLKVNGVENTFGIGEIIHRFGEYEQKRIFLGYIGEIPGGKPFIIPVVSPENTKQSFVNSFIYRNLPKFVKSILHSTGNTGVDLVKSYLSAGFGFKAAIGTMLTTGAYPLSMEFKKGDEAGILSMISVFNLAVGSSIAIDAASLTFPDIEFLGFAEPVDLDFADVKKIGLGNLFKAIEINNVSGIKKILLDNPDILNYQGAQGTTALHYAVSKKNLAVVKYLVEQGAILNIQDSAYSTPLDVAVDSDTEDIKIYLEGKGGILAKSKTVGGAAVPAGAGSSSEGGISPVGNTVPPSEGIPSGSGVAGAGTIETGVASKSPLSASDGCVIDEVFWAEEIIGGSMKRIDTSKPFELGLINLNPIFIILKLKSPISKCEDYDVEVSDENARISDVFSISKKYFSEEYSVGEYYLPYEVDAYRVDKEKWWQFKYSLGKYKFKIVNPKGENVFVSDTLSVDSWKVLSSEEEKISTGITLPSARLDPSAEAMSDKFNSDEFILINRLVKDYSEDIGVSENLIKAIISQESDGNRNADGDSKKSFGLMMIQKDAAKDVGMDDKFDSKKLDVSYNIFVGTAYYKQIENKYSTTNSGEDLKKISILAYNWGQGNVNNNCLEKKWSKCNNVPETKLLHIANVLGYERWFDVGVAEVVDTGTPSGSSTEFENARKQLFDFIVEQGDINEIKNLVSRYKQQGILSVTNNLGNTALHGAAGFGDLEVVKYLVEQGADVNVKNNEGSTPLEVAEENNGGRGRDEIVSYLEDVNSFFDSTKGYTVQLSNSLKEHPEFISAVSSGKTALHQTFLSEGLIFGKSEHKDVVEVLLNNGAKVNAKDDEGSTALHYASSNRFHDSAELLMHNGADANILNKDYEAPLDFAFGDDRMIKILGGTDVSSQIFEVKQSGTYSEFSIYFKYENSYWRFSQDNQRSWTEASIDSPKDVSNLNKDTNRLRNSLIGEDFAGGKELILSAIKRIVSISFEELDISEVKDIGKFMKEGIIRIKNGEIVNYVGTSMSGGIIYIEEGAIVKGIGFGMSGNARIFVEAGDGSIGDNLLLDIIYIGALNKGYVQIIYEKFSDEDLELINSASSCDSCGDGLRNNCDKRECWLINLKYGDCDYSKPWWKFGGGVCESSASLSSGNVVVPMTGMATLLRDYNDITNAVENGDINTLQSLVKTSEDANLINEADDVPIHYISDKTSVEIVKYLLEKGADINAENSEKYTPLYNAAEANNFEVVEYLVSNGANFNVQNIYGKTSLDIAEEKGLTEIANYLQSVDDFFEVVDSGSFSNLDNLEYVQDYLNSNPEFVYAIKDGKTALQIAGDNDDTKMIEFLENPLALTTPSTIATSSSTATVVADAKTLEEFYNNAKQDYNTIINSYAGERLSDGLGTTYGEKALFDLINLARDLRQMRTATLLSRDFVSRFPKSKMIFDVQKFIDDNYKNANSEVATRNVLINGVLRQISFEGIVEPTVQDYSVEVSVSSPSGRSISATLIKDQVLGLSEAQRAEQIDFGNLKVNKNTVFFVSFAGQEGVYIKYINNAWSFSYDNKNWRADIKNLPESSVALFKNPLEIRFNKKDLDNLEKDLKKSNFQDGVRLIQAKGGVVRTSAIADEFIILKELDKDYAIFDVGGINKDIVSKTLSTNNLRIKLKDYQIVGVNKYRISVNKINLKKYAKVSVVPNINNQFSTASFDFKIGIEKRSISLSPEKTKEIIEKLNKTIEKWSEISGKLGTVVKGLRGACLATGAVLTVKNFFSNTGGLAIARQNVMKNKWNKKCAEMKSAGEYEFIEECLVENKKEIEGDVEAYEGVLKKLNEEIKLIQKNSGAVEDGGLFGETVIDDDKFCEAYLSPSYRSELKEMLTLKLGQQFKVQNEEIVVSDFVDNLDCSRVSIEDLRSLQLNSRLGSSFDDMSKISLQTAIKTISVNTKDVVEASSYQSELSAVGSGFVADHYGRKDAIKGIYRGKTLSGDKIIGARGLEPDKEYPVQPISYANEKYFLILDGTGSRYGIRQAYKYDGVVGDKVKVTPVDSKTDSELRGAFSEFVQFDAKSYQNKFKATSGRSVPEIRYYETAPYKGFPAIVPFDLNNGWYAAVKSTLGAGGNIRSYDESGRVSSFYVCNVGPDGMENFKAVGDDICEMINTGTGQPYNQFPGLDTSQASKIIRCGVNAIQQAQEQRQRTSGISNVKIKTSCGGSATVKVGNPAFDVPDISCSDFMSVSDCQIMFNVCDPVVCPPSRCDLGGAYPVRDVIQSGIIGSLALCFPNWRKGIYIPICLSGVKAGIDGLLSVFSSYESCLQENLDSGKMVGICDEIYSIHLCDFFWRQGLPLARIGIPKMIEALTGQNTRGGGEYLGVQSAWENAEKSVDFFTQYYAANAAAGFQSKIADVAKDAVCQNFVSASYPDGGNLIDQLTNPQSPPQFHGRFDEIPFTTATNPPISQYKVFYHIFAGQEAQAYYQVYLKGTAGGSFYQDTIAPRIVASGYIATGGTASETRDFTAPAGYKELCINVNGQEECGFKSVSTDFALNYVSDKYRAEQAATKDVKSESECISGSRSVYSLATISSQGLADDLANPAIYNQGIVRICATASPGKGTDNNDGGNNSRWVDIGYCDNQKMRCWQDMNRVADVIRNSDIQNEVLSEQYDRLEEILERSGDYLNAEAFEKLIGEIEKEKDNSNRVGLITDAVIKKAFLSLQKAKLFSLRADAFANLARGLAGILQRQEDAAATTVVVSRESGVASDGSTIDGRTPTSEVEPVIEGSTAVEDEEEAEVDSVKCGIESADITSNVPESKHFIKVIGDENCEGKAIEFQLFEERTVLIFLDDKKIDSARIIFENRIAQNIFTIDESGDYYVVLECPKCKESPYKLDKTIKIE